MSTYTNSNNAKPENSINFITPNSDLGGARYPLLANFDNWTIRSIPIEDMNPHSKSEANEVMRWVKDDKVLSLFIPNMTTEDFFAATGFKLHVGKSPYVTSKRASRLMRPYFISGYFGLGELNVLYLEQDEFEKQVWDGAGIISRRVLLQLAEQLPEGLPSHKAALLRKELAHCGRIEMTLVGPKGQDKCHAIVLEEDEMQMGADFILPEDTKTDAILNGKYLVALQPVAGHPNDVRIDIQTLINNRGFWKVEDLLQWLHQEGELFLNAIHSGRIAKAMSRLDSSTSMKELEAWHVREAFASGMNAMWFGSIIRDLVNQQLNRLEYQTHKKFKLPIPGGRLYIMADAVAGKSIPEGQIELDPKNNTAWVNSRDWYNYIKGVLGGADQDDALIVFCFTDYDGIRKVFICRNPNQVGEYVVLLPTENSYTIEWETINGKISFPEADSRRLPARIDSVEQKYLNLVNADDSNLYRGEYSIEAMNGAIARAQENAGVLGLYCNLLMVALAIYGRMPKEAPAKLEEIIDSSVKTGAALGRVREWILMAGERILSSGVEVPQILQGRIPRPEGNKQRNPKTSNHWLDEIEGGILSHITWLEAERDELMKAAKPPVELFAAVLRHKPLMEKGAQFNSVYARALKESKKQELARARCQAFLDGHCEGDEIAEEGIILAAAANYYLNNRDGLDGSVWQMGERTEGGRKAGIAQIMIRALRGIGLLNEITEEDGYILRYPAAQVRDQGIMVKINGVWFNYAKTTWKAESGPMPQTMGELPKEAADAFKQQISNIKWAGVTFSVREDENKAGRLKAYGPKGNLLGYIENGQEHQISEKMQILYAVADDGNLKAVLKAV
jgi:hypothetical protein